LCAAKAERLQRKQLEEAVRVPWTLILSIFFSRRNMTFPSWAKALLRPPPPLLPQLMTGAEKRIGGG